MQNDIFFILRDILNNYQVNGLTKEVLEESLKSLIPKKDEKLLVEYNIREKGLRTIMFVPQFRSITGSINKINEWLDKNTHDFLQDIDSCESEVLRGYLFLFVITHEIEHSHQFLVGEGIIEAPTSILKNAYKGLIDLLIPNNYIIPRPIKEIREFISMILYKRQENFYLLERNAIIEGTDLISKFALFNDREDIHQLFNDWTNAYLKCGYTESCIGSIEETYRKILMYDKYKKFYHPIDLSEEDRLRYGFSISEETRNTILTRKK